MTTWWAREPVRPERNERNVIFMLRRHAIFIIIIIIIIIIILTAIGLAPGGSSPVHIYREHYIEYTNNTQNT